ncbi:TonB-dependent receptor [Sphingobium indicum]|uniref:TonB-dependent receptor n=1 Tax=Sphingobium indicum TaxID=332055 RepID=A0A4Q4JA83_9SPHN|nr:TonB-dependent receptor [Sphingobium indicum]NYI21938.1 outer membrane receptor protein involved in Fe transport [Sphingobium indicum]RYM03303.1 TonB-dependent receptor [Sphingobium indicum]
MRDFNKSRTKSFACAGVALSALLWGSASHAQSAVEAIKAPAALQSGTPNNDPAEPAGHAGEEAASEIVVTGSRISRTGFTAPTPVTTISAEEIQNRAPSSLADVLVTIPSFRPTNTPTTSGVNSRGGGIVTADLRGLGATRTLVLVNGRRFVPSGTDGVVDLKLIPTLLIGSAETVTGGASAAWGSDAVAGVINFILKDKLEGVQGTIQNGISEQGDNAEFRASLAAGATLMGGRLRLLIGGDYIHNKGIPNQYSRDWGRREVGLITNAAYADNGLPNYIIAPQVYPSLMTPGGLITSGPLRGTAFGAGGTPYQFDFGQVFGSQMIGGGNQGNHLSRSTQLAAPYEAKIVMAKADFDLTDAVTLFAEVNGAWSSSGGFSQQSRDAGTLTIRRDNAYLPESVRQAMVTNNLDTIAVGRLNNDAGPVRVHSSNETLRFVTGFRANLGGSWKLNGYVQYGQNTYDVASGPNNRIVANYMRAIDAVFAPGGQIVCRSTLANPADGCKPQNIFGDGSLVVDDYSFGTASFHLRTEQRVASLNINGDIFSTWAGPVSIAAGIETRKEEAAGTSDPLSTQVQANGSIGAFQIGNQVPIVGSYSLWEAYGEAVVPLLRDSPLGKSLDLNAAVRRTDYSTSGTVTTWKAGLSYTPFAGLRLRATRSRDIRAPNLAELFQNGGSSFVNVFDSKLGTVVQVREVQQGNPDLRPEKADTWTMGFVVEPAFLRGFQLSVDYYDIDVQDVIAGVPSALAVSRCSAGLTLFCSSIAFNPDGTIRNTILQQLNLNSLKTAGIDVEARFAFEPGFMPGRIALRALASYVDKFVTVDAAGATDRVGQVSQFNRAPGVPHFTGVGEITYSNADFLANLQVRMVGKGVYNNAFTQGSGAANTINDNHIPAYAYLGLNLSQGITAGRTSFTLFGTINNLLDTDPPMIPSGSIGFANETSTNPAFYDVIGRSFKIGVRFSL